MSDDRRRRRSGLTPRRPSAPGLLDPILAAWERVDRRRRQIRPIRRGGVLGLEAGRYQGDPLRLGDGTLLRSGDRIGVIHLDNEHIRTFAVDGWLADGWREGLADLRALARWARRGPSADRPVAYTATTILVPLARRAGFEIHPRRRTAWARLEDWHYRSLMRRWNPHGAERLHRGHGRLRSSVVWLSAGELQRRYGDAEPGRPPGPSGPAALGSGAGAQVGRGRSGPRSRAAD